MPLCSKFLGKKVHSFNVILHKRQKDVADVPRKATSYKIFTCRFYICKVNLFLWINERARKKRKLSRTRVGKEKYCYGNRAELKALTLYRIDGIVIMLYGGVSPDGFQPVRCGDFKLFTRTRINCART